MNNGNGTTALATRPRGEVATAPKTTKIMLDYRTKALVIEDEQGGFKRAVIDISIDAMEGDVWRFGLQPGEYVMNGPGKPTAKLLQRIAGIIGLQIVNPPTQMIGRDGYPNPYIDDVKGEVWISSRAIGRSFATGELRIMQQTTVLRTNSAFAQGIAEKIKKGRFPKGGYAYVSIRRAKEFEEKRGPEWVDVPLSAPGITLYVDATAPEFADAINNHEKFYGSLTKRAKNIADRNIIESFLGLSQIVMRGGKGVYKAVVWRPMSSSEVAGLHSLASDMGADANAGEAENENVIEDAGVTYEADGTDTATADGEVVDAETGEVVDEVTGEVCAAETKSTDEADAGDEFDAMYEKARDKAKVEGPRGPQGPPPVFAELQALADRDRGWCLKRAKTTLEQVEKRDFTDEQLATLRRSITAVRAKRGM